MNVLSLFDGMSGARQALKNLGVTPTLYCASEINGPAMAIASKNFPEIVQLGNVNDRNFAAIDTQWDLLIFGSPCTDLSVAKKNRQSLAGKSSGLFYRALDILKAVRPKHFLMENVASMSDESRDEISRLLGVKPVEINSRYFTGQNRSRLYWFNWKLLEVPPSQPVYFRDKLLPIQAFDLIKDDIKISEAGLQYMNRVVNGGRNHWDFKHHSDTDEPFSACVVANFKKGVPYNVLLDRRAYHAYRPNVPNLWPWARKFHPIECERLQGFPDDYSDGVAWTHRYEMLGNAFTVPVVQFLLKPII